MKNLLPLILVSASVFYSGIAIKPVIGEIIADDTVATQVNVNDNLIEITGGKTAGNNLFHSFQEFSVPSSAEAFFNNPDTVENIINRVTGGSISDINGLIRANGAANLFLINPAGIIFGPDASLNIGGSFIGSTADSVVFPEGEFGTTDIPSQSLITINAPIGLRFREQLGDIVNQSVFNGDTGLSVLPDQTLALIGGNLFIEGGLIFTPGGRIELGSVAGHSLVDLTEIEQGWDISYENVSIFQDISLSGAALVASQGEMSGDIEVQGRRITLKEGSEISSIAFGEGQAGNITIIAAESLALDGTTEDLPFDLGFFTVTQILNLVEEKATGTGSKVKIVTEHLTLSDGGQINANTFSTGQGVDIEITASNIQLDGSFEQLRSGIFAQVGNGLTPQNITGDAGDITINTDNLSLTNGATIATTTFGFGRAGNLTVNAAEVVELIGTVPGTNLPSSLFADVGILETATGDGGDLTVNTKNLIVREGAQINTTAQNEGNGGNIEIKASESILVSGFSPLAEFRGQGRSGIFVGAEPAIIDEAGNPIVSTGNGGDLTITAPQIIVEQGGQISANNFGLGEGGNLIINGDTLTIRQGGEIGAGSVLESGATTNTRGAGGSITIKTTDLLEVIGTGEINGEPLSSSLFTLAQGTGNAGDLILTTNNLTVKDGGIINASATGIGAAGELIITANNIDLDQGTLAATTAAGGGGNINLDVAQNLTLANQSLVSAEATAGTADSGNVTINSEFIIAIPDQNNDILARAVGGRGGNITITTEGLLGIESRPLNNVTNDINASSQSNIDGTISLDIPEVNVLKTTIDLSQHIIPSETLVSQLCQSSGSQENSFIIQGKGGVIYNPTNPLNGDILITETNNASISQTKIPEKVNPETLIVARGIIIKEDGSVILTSYPTPGTPGYRSYQQKVSCHYQPEG